MRTGPISEWPRVILFGTAWTAVGTVPRVPAVPLRRTRGTKVLGYAVPATLEPRYQRLRIRVTKPSYHPRGCGITCPGPLRAPHAEEHGCVGGATARPCRFPRTRARDLLGRGGICRMGSAFGDRGPSLRSEGRRRGRVRRRSTRRSPAHGSLRIASWARAGWRAPSQANWEVLDAEFAGRCDCRGCHPPVAEDFSYEDALSQWHGEWRCRAGGRVKEGSRFCG